MYDVFFSTLADRTKLDIINILSKNDLNVSEISKKLNLEQSRVSHNLKVLLERNFVIVSQKGKSRVYSLEKKTITPLLKIIDKHVENYYSDYCKCKGIPWRKRA